MIMMSGDLCFTFYTRKAILHEENIGSLILYCHIHNSNIPSVVDLVIFHAEVTC